MRRQFLTIVAFLSACLFYACGPSGESAQEAATETETMEEVAPALSISPAPASPEYADAMLEATGPTDGATLTSGDSVEFTYGVTNYELGAPTPDADQKPLAASPKGQHVHLILNNEPYYAIYQTEGFKLALDDGHYVALSFLSRSYHESVKNPEAYKVSQFTVGEGEAEEVDLSQPMLFYSRPKGTYSGADAESVLFDFYPVNTEIGPGGNQVKVSINSDTTFMVDQWQPYVIQGMPMGENTISIELVDSEGNLVDSPMNSVSRTFTLEGGEPAM
ncbi:phosphopeptide-binding protein [Tunicatimonas pelagia]|uniref:phosphopeptide-binding protein n=1 Tax=Tunicatimonas pelagia TaxID=931531 RepID=UPI002666532F|nr:phosphopeptide-binding protein [Tunicatimonas pelagia]WKN40689.1 phosphopeptide-binding protein [Tunicatimonas pelagia]